MNCTGKKKKKQDDSHCGSGCYWISVDDFPSPGEDDVLMNLECVRKKVEGLEKVTCIIELIFVSCKAFQPLLYYFEVHCHCFRISSFYPPESQNSSCGDDGNDDREQDKKQVAFNFWIC